MSKNNELIIETDKEKWERLVMDNIALVHYINNMMEDLPSDKVNFLHICALLSYIKDDLINGVNMVLTGDKAHLGIKLVEEAKDYGA